jgi:putative ABC transport system substrate-binding protein
MMITPKAFRMLWKRRPWKVSIRSPSTASAWQSSAKPAGPPHALSYGPEFEPLYRGAAVFIDKIFKGAKAAELPVELPTKFELVINLKTAKALGVEVPAALLLRADKVIE